MINSFVSTNMTNDVKYYQVDPTLLTIRERDNLLNMDPQERAKEMTKYPQSKGPKFWYMVRFRYS